MAILHVHGSPRSRVCWWVWICPVADSSCLTVLHLQTSFHPPRSLIRSCMFTQWLPDRNTNKQELLPVFAIFLSFPSMHKPELMFSYIATALFSSNMYLSIYSQGSASGLAVVHFPNRLDLLKSLGFQLWRQCIPPVGCDQLASCRSSELCFICSFYSSLLLLQKYWVCPIRDMGNSSPDSRSVFRHKCNIFATPLWSLIWYL